MRHAMLALAGALLLAASTGCTHSRVACNHGCSAGCTGGCNQCGLATAYQKGAQQYGGCDCANCAQGADGQFAQGGGPAGGGLLSSKHAGLAADAAMAASGVGMVGLAAKHAKHLGGGRGNDCGPYGGCDREYKATRRVAGPMGPPSAHITYPYYTTRGPRDFFAASPMSIGP